MQAVTSGRLVRRGLAISAAAVLLSGGPAFAGGPDDNTTQPPPADGGGQKHGEIYAKVSFTPANGHDGPGRGPLKSTDVSWSPPACWYAPMYGAKEYKEKFEKGWAEDSGKWHGTAGSAMAQVRDHYTDGLSWPDHPGYKDFNVAEDGKGMFWGGVENPESTDTLARGSCSEIPFWVENGKTPPIKNAISPELLSQLAYQRMRVPGTNVSLSPQTNQTVNLPTWVWLSGAEYAPVTVRASVAGGTIWAETTATPVSVRIDPGTPDANVFPAGGNCPIGADGHVGTPYTKGSTGSPPCGVTYLRSTPNGASYQLTVTVTWKVSWRGSDGPATHALPDGVFGAPNPVTVREIQSVVR
ncbi:hypothetical protein [Streptomyces sp. H39-S7]|uniref:hypothetical protein n=1 Tax=Streptomyces sp. H39-S7 TaxID=3004357 RepID=UPI0022AF9212|nr:hypothetical protein [Streptomyces sp. H39-S7]MCZ4120107.1 hypothetical protein [Streptomyces sp. H39-S7]